VATAGSTPGRGAGSLALAVRFANVDRAAAVTPRLCGRCRQETPDEDLWILLPRVQLACSSCKDRWLDEGAPVL